MGAAGSEITIADITEQDTQHGLLVAFGQFAEETGLRAGLERIRIPQKIGSHRAGITPQTKLIEFTAGILSGIAHLQDLSLGAQPMAKDPAVAEAWGQERFVHFTNVGRTLNECDVTTREDLRRVIDAFTQPFLAEALADELLAGREIELDVDLTGQPVSTTSETYPQARFGWMDGEIRLGYQVARVCVHTQRYGRIWLAGYHHPGNAVSVMCLQDLVRAAEAKTGLRPRRRPELVAQRLAGVRQRGERQAQWLAQAQDRLASLEARRIEQIGRQYYLQQMLQDESRPSRRARWQAQLEAVQRRLPRLTHQLGAQAGIVAYHQMRLLMLRQEETHLQTWQAQLEADNVANPNAPVCLCRTDSGFCSGLNLTWLIEMGYQVETKAGDRKVIDQLKKRGPEPGAGRTSRQGQGTWTPVGDNAEMKAWSTYYLSDCPYALAAGLERFTRTPRTRSQQTQLQYGVLLAYRDTPAWPTLPAWFTHYNHRQTIEAGNKQTKTVHHMQHLMCRTKVGIEIQVLLTELACNFTHFIQPWLRASAQALTPRLAADLRSPKAMVRVLANSAARVQRTPCSTTLTFASCSSLPDVKLCLHGLPLHQLSLGLFRPMQIAT